MIKVLIISLSVLSNNLESPLPQADSVKLEEKGNDRNMMLNAESATVPREINIGLPDTGNGAAVYLDGSKHSFSLPEGYQHWVGCNSYESTGMLSLMESVIRVGQVGVMVQSNTRLGTESTTGKFTAGSSTNGLIRLDGSLAGPLAKSKGWYYSLGAYINYDPTNVNTPTRKYVDQMQMYQGSLSKRWADSSLDFIYRFSMCNYTKNAGYNFAPFVYNGDGSISMMDGFRIGQDCYFPADDNVTYMDISTGKTRTGSLAKMDNRYIHDFTLNANHRHSSGWNFNTTLHACLLQPSQSVKTSLAGISQGGMTLDHGCTYDGYVQKRLALVNDSRSFDVELFMKADRKWERHSLRTGLSLLYLNQREASSSFYFAHTASKNPERLYLNDADTWGMNTNGQFHHGWRAQASLYAIDDWTISDRLMMRTGVRLKPVYQNTLSAAQIGDDVETGMNARRPGFNIADKTMCTLRDLTYKWFDWSVSEHMDLRLVDRLFFMAEGFYSLTCKGVKYFRNSSIPSTKQICIAMGRAGLTYDNRWMDIAALFSYIRSWNDALIINVVDPVNGGTIPWTAEYGIGTPGFTLDGNVHFGGFNMHALFTWQDPKYKDYSNEFKWDDGTTTKIDYTGKYVTGISQYMVEIDPSYTWKNVKVWASARYYSRQYVSRTNLAYFNGHWETFAGVNLKLGKGVDLSFNVVNLLFDKGAQGSIDSVDTISDPEKLKNLVLAGTYIRPFTVDMMVTYKF